MLWKYTGKNEKFYNLIKDKIISEQILNCKEAKTMIFANKNKKNLTNRCEHPSSEDLYYQILRRFVNPANSTPKPPKALMIL